MRRTPEAQALSPRGFRLLTGIAMEWDGHNNAAIVFTRGEHGAAVGLGHFEIFEAALREVLESKLIAVTRRGGPNQPAKYAITTEPFQMNPDEASRRKPKPRTVIRSESDPTIRSESDPIGLMTGSESDPSWYGIRPNHVFLDNKNARARTRASESENSKTENATRFVAPAVLPAEANQGDAVKVEGAGVDPSPSTVAASVPRVSGSDCELNERASTPNLRLVRAH